MWKAIETNDLELNKLATRIAYYSLWSHVLGLGIGLYIETKRTTPMILGLFLLVIGFDY